MRPSPAASRRFPSRTETVPLDILTIGEALVEVMRTDIDQPLNEPGPFVGPIPSGEL